MAVAEAVGRGLPEVGEGSGAEVDVADALVDAEVLAAASLTADDSVAAAAALTGSPELINRAVTIPAPAPAMMTTLATAAIRRCRWCPRRRGRSATERR